MRDTGRRLSRTAAWDVRPENAHRSGRKGPCRFAGQGTGSARPGRTDRKPAPHNLFGQASDRRTRSFGRPSVRRMAQGRKDRREGPLAATGEVEIGGDVDFRVAFKNDLFDPIGSAVNGSGNLRI